MFFIHVDEKTPSDIYAEMTEPLSSLSNIFFLDRHRCTWGGFGHVLATLKGLGALEDERAEFDYVILLTGQDYPVKSTADIQGFLRASAGLSYMDYFPLPRPEWPGNGGLDRLNHWHFYPFGRHMEYPVKSPWRFHQLNLLWNQVIDAIPVERSLPNGLRPFGGSSYWCLSRECVEYINQFLCRNTWYVRWFKHTWVSDELFFQTILLNSSLKTRLVNNNLRYIQWSRGSPSPDVLSAMDFDNLARTDKLFARKFDGTIAPKILDLIDQQLL